jgi:hypothetical protein
MGIFYVLHIREKVLADCVDAIRFICNPAEKQRAHLTVRGPYEKRIDISTISRKIVGDTVSIDSVGNFFGSGQNTVFFHCSAPELRNVWSKPHYPFNPHITLYDGDSPGFAHKLYSVVSKYHYSLRFQAAELEPIEATKGQNSLALALAFNSKLVKQIIGEQIRPSLVSGFSEERRLHLVERFCQHLSALPPAGQKGYQHRLAL